MPENIKCPDCGESMHEFTEPRQLIIPLGRLAELHLMLIGVFGKKRNVCMWCEAEGPPDWRMPDDVYSREDMHEAYMEGQRA